MKLEKAFQLHAEGKISDSTLLLFGMSGELPDYDAYKSMEESEKVKFWNNRMEKKLGPNWRERFRSLPAFLKRVITNNIPQWIKDGF